MIVDDFRRSAEAGLYELSARMRPQDGETEPFRLWFRFPEEHAPGGDLDASPFLPPALTWCLRKSERLVIEGPVSPRLLGELDEIMAVYRSFFPGAIRAAITVEAESREPAAGTPRTASLFTRGVDSWFGVLTALEDPELQPPLTHAVYSPDFDSRFWSPELRDAKVVGNREAAARVGLELIRFDSNVAERFGRGQFSAALALGFTTVLIPSGNMRGEIVRQGTHPSLDPRFSTERTRILHYGDASRIQKIERIAESQAALDTIRVCRYDRMETDLNCGRCEKCLRTMVGLHAVGALERCPAFDAPLEVSALASVNKMTTVRHTWLELQNALGESEFDRRLADAVRMAIFRHDLRFAAHRADVLSARRPHLRPLLGDSAERVWELDREIERRLSAPGKARRRGRLARLLSRS
jgi:hypothetical protein